MIIDDCSRALGVFLNEESNAIRSDENRLISHQFSKVDVFVIPTNEEVEIARDTMKLLHLDKMTDRSHILISVFFICIKIC